MSHLQFYLRTGGCKFGNACRYNHTRPRALTSPILELNFLGLPIRPVKFVLYCCLMVNLFHIWSVAYRLSWSHPSFIPSFIDCISYLICFDEYNDFLIGRMKKNVPITCAQDPANMEQTASLIILILQPLLDLNLFQDITMEFPYKVHPNHRSHHGLHQEYLMKPQHLYLLWFHHLKIKTGMGTRYYIAFISDSWVWSVLIWSH